MNRFHDDALNKNDYRYDEMLQQVQVAGHEIISNQSEAFQALGYCPQHDALWRNITVREHLEAYAIIRGIEPSHINRSGHFFYFLTIL